MEIIKCKICGKIFYKNEISATCAPVVFYDYNACDECNKEARKNTKNNF